MYKPSWHIDVISEHLEAAERLQIRNLIINIPPRHMKSLAVSVFWPTYVWTHSPWTRWLFGSYGSDLSTRDSIKCRRIIQSPWYQNRYHEMFQLTGDQNLKTRFENTMSGHRIATSIGGVGTGEGGDFLIADDPHKVDEAESELKRTEAVDWFNQTLSTRGNDPETVVKVLVMQRVHELDCTGVSAESGGWHWLTLPAEYEAPTMVDFGGYDWTQPATEPQAHKGCPFGEDPRTIEGELLAPERFNQVALDALKKTLGPIASAAQLQQRPVPKVGAMFQDEWFKPLPDGFDVPRGDDYKSHRQRTTPVQYWDLAFSERQGADFTVGLTCARDTDDNLFITNVWRGQVNEAHLDEVIASEIYERKVRLAAVEEAAFKQASTRDLVRRVYKRLALIPWECSVIPIRVTTDKVFRSQLPRGRALAGYLYADRKAPWWPQFIREMLRFPKSKNDDQVDALSGAVQLAIERIGSTSAPPRETYNLGKTQPKKESSGWLADLQRGIQIRRARTGQHRRLHATRARTRRSTYGHRL